MHAVYLTFIMLPNILIAIIIMHPFSFVAVSIIMALDKSL